MAADDAVAAAQTTAQETETGLPKWLDDMLQPGVSNGVFLTLKLCLVSLVIVLCIMLYVIQDPVRARARSTQLRARAPCH